MTMISRTMLWKNEGKKKGMIMTDARYVVQMSINTTTFATDKVSEDDDGASRMDGT